MSLPIAGAKKKPSRAPTHTPLDTTRLMKLAGELEDAAEEGQLTAELIDELAEDNGVDREHYYAALPLTDVELTAPEGTPSFVVCVGGCQGWGALPCIGALLDARDERIQSGGSTFAVRVKSCLDRCDKAAVVEVHTADGTAVIAEGTPDAVVEAIDHLGS